jgi:hypothetical protein
MVVHAKDLQHAGIGEESAGAVAVERAELMNIL